jgi:hypothetical protein
MVADRLQDLVNDWDGCAAAGFADLSAQMVLVHAGNSRYQREALDQLCAEAVVLLNAPTSTGRVQHAVMAMADQTRIYLRASADPDDALCCICSPDIAVGPFLAAASACLEQISTVAALGAGGYA